MSTDGLTFQWTLLEKPAGSTAALNASDLASPAFFADMQGAYKLQAMVTDRLGNLARSTLLTVTTQTCGKNLINASVIDTAGARPFDAHILSVATSSDDDDLNKCPARRNLIAHQHREGMVAFGGVFNTGLFKGTGSGVHGGFP